MTPEDKAAFDYCELVIRKDLPNLPSLICPIKVNITALKQKESLTETEKYRLKLMESILKDFNAGLLS